MAVAGGSRSVCSQGAAAVEPAHVKPAVFA